MNYFESLMENSKSLENFNQGFTTGDLLYRLGNPFIWVDGPITQGSELHQYNGKMALLTFFTMYYEFYETPKELLGPGQNLEELRGMMSKQFTDFFKTTFPYLKVENYANFIRCMTETNVQEYLMVSPHINNKTAPRIVDFGPGLGRHAAWIKTFHKNATYYGVEVFPVTYQIQNEYFRQFAPFYDMIEMEQFGVLPKSVKANAGDTWHVPTWHLNRVQDDVDCVIATFMLNETTTTGCLYLLHQAARLLKEGGVFYLRDSDKLKPSRHMINYDKALMDMGFECADRRDYKNRVDFFGVPRVYKRKKYTDDGSISFEKFCSKFIGKFDITSMSGPLAERVAKS